MATERAEALDDKQLEALLVEIHTGSDNPVEDVTIFLLSYKAGLRVQEIAGLDWFRHILDADGEIRTVIHERIGAGGRVKQDKVPALRITSDIGKKGNERQMIIHGLLLKHLVALRDEQGITADTVVANGEETCLVIPPRYNKGTTPVKGESASARDDKLKRRADALRKRIKRMYQKIPRFARDGYSSHLGRRTFITNAARSANNFGCSLEDVRQMAGHRQIATTQKYVSPSAGVADLILNM